MLRRPLSIESLKERKNELFAEALTQLETRGLEHRHIEIIHRLDMQSGNWFVFHFATRKSLSRSKLVQRASLYTLIRVRDSVWSTTWPERRSSRHKGPPEGLRWGFRVYWKPSLFVQTAALVRRQCHCHSHRLSGCLLSQPLDQFPSQPPLAFYVRVFLVEAKGTRAGRTSRARERATYPRVHILRARLL